jgi:DtxR family Mn-dependent transcriptional regulator
LEQEYYTMKGYERQKEAGLTAAMEDYLEMICRLLQTQNVVRIHQLAEHLHVKPSSASKMVQNLKKEGYLEFEKYGYLTLTEKGRQMGHYLLRRHRVLQAFLCYINHSESELTQVEKIEHFIDAKTICNLESWMKKEIESKKTKDNPKIP